MNCSDEFKDCLTILARETGNSKDFRESVESLLKLHRNILYNPENEKYCRINLANKMMESLWKFEGAKLFLTRVGWQEQENRALKFIPKEADQLKLALRVLQDFRLIAPEESEWIEANKVEDLTQHIRKEENERAEAAKQREKKLKTFFDEQKKHKEFAASIKKQIKADADARKLRPLHSSPAKSKSTGSVASKNAAQAAVKRLAAGSTTDQKIH